jgi:hypothetical protein
VKDEGRDEPPDEIILSQVDPRYECVPIGTQKGGKNIAEPPPGGGEEPAGLPLCPDGYVPRLRRVEYRLSGKQVITGEPPKRRAK